MRYLKKEKTMRTFLIILIIAAIAVGIGYMAAKNDPELYQKMEQVEEDVEDCAKQAYKDAKSKGKKLMGCDQDKDNTNEVIIIETVKVE
jgi:hypothetical protein